MYMWVLLDIMQVGEWLRACGRLYVCECKNACRCVIVFVLLGWVTVAGLMVGAEEKYYGKFHADRAN